MVDPEKRGDKNATDLGFSMYLMTRIPKINSNITKQRGIL